MRKTGLALTCVAALMFAAGAALAQSTLLDQSKIDTDALGNPLGIDAVLVAAILADGNSSQTSFVVQAGGGSYTGIYGKTTGGGSGFIPEYNGEPEEIDIWCDIEMYLHIATTNNKIYFHRADMSAGEQVAYVQGTFTSNHGWYVGLEAPREGCDITKLIGTVDVLGRDISPTSPTRAATPIDVTYTLSDQGSGYTGSTPSGAYNPPTTTDPTPGDQNSVMAYWWYINQGAAGTQIYEWKVSINPPAEQADGHYELDPVVTAKPSL